MIMSPELAISQALSGVRQTWPPARDSGRGLADRVQLSRPAVETKMFAAPGPFFVAETGDASAAGARPGRPAGSWAAAAAAATARTATANRRLRRRFLNLEPGMSNSGRWSRRAPEQGEDGRDASTRCGCVPGCV